MKSKKPTLYIMCGLPFSGKSTLAKTIATTTDSQLVGFDLVWKEEEDNLDPDLNKTKEWEFILDLAFKKIKSYLKEGKSVVYDDTNLKKEHRDKLRDLAKRFNAESKVIYINTSLDEIRKRIERNLNTQVRHNVSDLNFQSSLAQLEVPINEQNIIEYKAGTDINLWLKNNLL